MAMMMVILEAHISPDKWGQFEGAYKASVQALDPGIVETRLIHSAIDPTYWRILTVWRNREALEKVRERSSTLPGVLLFREAGTEPRLAVYQVVAQATEARLAA